MRSSPKSCALTKASFVGIMPRFSPSLPTTRTSGTRMLSLIRTSLCIKMNALNSDLGSIFFLLQFVFSAVKHYPLLDVLFKYALVELCVFCTKILHFATEQYVPEVAGRTENIPREHSTDNDFGYIIGFYN